MLAGAQQTGEKKKEEPPPKKEESAPAPLFQGQLAIRSSERTKESATFGFNGIDPSGKVEARMFAASPGSAEREKVKQMAANMPSDADLAAFLEQGGLNRK